MNEILLTWGLGVSVFTSIAWMAAFGLLLIRGQAIEAAAL